LEECLAALEQPRGPHEPEPVEIDSLYPETALPLFDSIAPEEALGFFSSPVEDYRRRAALSFTDDDYEDGVRDALLALSRDDASPAVRGAALRALGERLEEPPVRALLVEALSSRREHAEEWLGALVGLATAGSEPAVTRAIEAAYDRPGCRAGALEAMWRSLDPGWEPYFGPNLRGEDVEVRRQAIQGAGALGITELAIDLLPFLDDEDCREDALFSYALAVSGKTSPRFVRRLLEDIDEKAGGLSAAEEELVSLALDRRLERDGLAPVFFPPHEHEDHHHHDAPPEAEQRASVKAGRNDPCPCGSGKKYKKCCGA
jgi:HEAT repeat protein